MSLLNWLFTKIEWLNYRKEDNQNYEDLATKQTPEASTED